MRTRPSYDLENSLQELNTLLNGTRGTIEQTYHYITEQGAQSWLKKSTQDDWVAAFSSLPMEEIADAILYRLKKTSYDQESLDILSLGAGYAREERRLIQILQKNTKIQNIRLFMLDVSPLLLYTAYQRTQELFADNPNVQAMGIFGNFYHLQRYHDLLSISARSNRMMLVSMLGATFTNLEDELSFIRDSLSALYPNILSLLDLVQRYSPSNDPNAIRAADPWLLGQTKWLKDSEEFLLSPLLTYRQGAREQKISWEYVLDEHPSLIPNSYTVEVRAHLESNTRFTLRKFRRYQQEGVRDAFEREKWTLFRTFPFTKVHCLAYLFQKQ